MKLRTVAALIGALAITSAPFVLAVSGGGFPSNPQFTSVGVGTTASGVSGSLQASYIGVGRAPSSGITRIVSDNGGSGDGEIVSGTTTAGNAYFRVLNNGVGNWSFGSLRSDGSFEICSAVGVSGTCALKIDTSGNITTPAGGTSPWGSAPIVCSTACNATALKVGQTAIIYKSAATNRASVTTTALDPDLQFNSLPAGQYQVTGHFVFTTGAGGMATTPFSSGAITGGAGSIINSGDYTGYSGGVCSWQTALVQTATQTSHGVTAVQCSGSNTNVVANWTDLNVVPSVSTNFGLDWAQASSNVANSSINAGSWLQVVRVN